MKKKYVAWSLVSLILASLVVSSCAPAQVDQSTESGSAEAEEEIVVEPNEGASAEAPEDIILGMLFVGPYNDRGWSQAHYDAGLYVEEKLPGVSMVYLDKVNVADRPGTTPAQLAEELVSKGAKVIVFNSDDMKDSAHEFALANPDIVTIHASGDGNWQEGVNYKNISNLANVMGRMEYGKMIAGCAAALTSDTGKIAYLGPLINEETRRLASSAYLGAEYCWENYAGKDAADLTFEVKWIGFWFNIPGVTSDPTQISDDFFNNGFNVVISGIDTTEALVEAAKIRAEGKDVYAIPYDYKDACEGAEDVCLGVPYFNWGPAYVDVISTIMDGTFEPFFEWNGPDWSNINNEDSSAVGFTQGAALSEENSALVDDFIAELANGLNLWEGPMNLQDGTQYLADGEIASDSQVWYLPQLLEGIVGLSTPAE